MNATPTRAARPPVEDPAPNPGRRAGGGPAAGSPGFDPMSAAPASPDLEAARHLLAIPPLGRRTAPHVHADGFDWNALFGLVVAGAEQPRVLVATAYELWEARRAVALWELPAALDWSAMTRVVDALYLSHGRARTAPDPRRVDLDGAPSAEHAAVAHVLGSPRLATRVAPHVHPDGFDWHGLLASAQTMSRGQRLLVDIAHDLWTRGDAVGIWDVTRGLDASNFVRVVEALQAYRQAFAARGRAPVRTAAWSSRRSRIGATA